MDSPQKAYEENQKTDGVLVSEKTEDVTVKPGEIDDDSVAEEGQGGGEDYLERSKRERD